MSSATTESVLHLVGHVKLKKNEGELYLMSERLGWMVPGKGSFSVSHKYCDIKSTVQFPYLTVMKFLIDLYIDMFNWISAQKISPEGKPKVQLQVCLHDGEATTFHFINPAG